VSHTIYILVRILGQLDLTPVTGSKQRGGWELLLGHDCVTYPQMQQTPKCNRQVFRAFMWGRFFTRWLNFSEIDLKMMGNPAVFYYKNHRLTGLVVEVE
jgi:hypothetical protein